VLPRGAILVRALAALAVALLGLNLAGLVLPLRSPALGEVQNPKLRKGPVLPEAELYARLARRGETDAEYAVKATAAIHQGIAHYWSDEGVSRFNLRVPPWENYLLFLAQYVYPEQYRKYAFHDYRKAIARGVGLCNQQAMVLAQVLERAGVAARIVALSGHVVVMARVDPATDRWWVLDPDYGVIVPHSIREIERNPELIRAAYAAAGYDAATIDGLVQVYASPGNSVWPSARTYFGRKYYVEVAAYVAIWAIPVLLLLPWPLARARRHAPVARPAARAVPVPSRGGPP